MAFLNTAPVLRSRDVPLSDLVELDILAESLGNTELGTFLADMSTALKDGHDITIIAI